jgi:FtsP/CotA-like multicopper oxidase with cupredoxin domain
MTGPLIEVNEGDTIIVHVENNLDVPQSIRECFPLRSLNVDWHGMLQNGTGYMDGVPGFTQVSLRGQIA